MQMAGTKVPCLMLLGCSSQQLALRCLWLLVEFNPPKNQSQASPCRLKEGCQARTDVVKTEAFAALIQEPPALVAGTAAVVQGAVAMTVEGSSAQRCGVTIAELQHAQQYESPTPSPIAGLQMCVGQPALSLPMILHQCAMLAWTLPRRRDIVLHATASLSDVL